MTLNKTLWLTVLGMALAMEFAASAPAWAVDCAPLGKLPTYDADPAGPAKRDFDGVDFTVAKGTGGETETITVAGRTCRLVYTPHGDALSDLEIQSNYRQQLKQLGAQVLFTADGGTIAKLLKGTQETWLSISSQASEIDIVVVDKQPVKYVLTAPSGNDYPSLGHMPNYTAGAPDQKNFDQLAFTTRDGNDTRDITVQGRKILLTYTPKPGAPLASSIEIQENYRIALNNLGAQILFSDNGNTVARLDNKGNTVWIKIYSQDSETDVSIIEEKAFQPSIEPPKADALKAALEKDGRVALYVNFDFAKSTLKPDAKPVFDQIVQLMTSNPSWKLTIEGHTDNVGGATANQKLSESRAAAVVAALTTAGIAKDRLSSAGFGASKPIADNNTTEGRAKNRRVELVKR
jgi:outer membrane protein OmpA-like peptidoglycan-associated protein